MVVQVRELREDGVRERFRRNGGAVAHDEDLSGLLGLSVSVMSNLNEMGDFLKAPKF